MPRLNPSATPFTTALSLFNFKGVYFECSAEWAEQLFVSGVSGSGSLTWELIDAWLSTGEINGSTAYIQKKASGDWLPDWSKRRRIKAVLWIENDSNQIIHLNLGDVGRGETYPYKGIGFKITGNKLYGRTGNGSEGHFIELQTITARSTIVVEAVFTSGIRVDYYVNGVFKATETDVSYLPSGAQDNQIFTLWIENTEAVEKAIGAFRARVLIDG